MDSSFPLIGFRAAMSLEIHATLILGYGSPTKARDFEGPGGPETKQQMYEEANPGNDDVMGNVRQGGETRRP